MSDVYASFKFTLSDKFAIDVAFQAPGRGVTSLFGPSGSGKTTILRCFAGLVRAPEGKLVVNGECWQDTSSKVFLPTHKRPLGYVFQEARLFPHLSVRKNMDYGFRRIAPEERHIKFDDVVKWLGISHLLDRMPAGLSGGEQQRVAIARALLASPRMLLMDEPLSALDEISRNDILPYLERLPAELSIPVIYVTHSLQEVMRLADHMIWLAQGGVRATGPLQDVLTRSDFALDRRQQSGAIVEAVVSHHDTEFYLTELDSGVGRLVIKELSVPVGERVRLRILARDVSLSLTGAKDSSISNIFALYILQITESEPGQVLVSLGTHPTSEHPTLLALITRKSCVDLGLKPEMKMHAQVKSVSLMK